ncbi:hypothetical protein EGW08_013229, partial [Elysia chlorotica]
SIRLQLCLHQLLVLVDSSVQRGDDPTAYHPQLFTDLAYQPLVVGDQNNPALRRDKFGFNRLHVQMIRRLIKYEEVWTADKNDSNSGPFASEADVLPLDHRAPHRETDEPKTQTQTQLLTWEPARQQLDRVQGQVELVHVMLAEVADAEIPVGVAVSAARLHLPEQQFQQSCLPCTVVS